MSARTDPFTNTELRLMLAALRGHGPELRALVKEFEAAMDERIADKINRLGGQPPANPTDSLANPTDNQNRD